MRQYYRRSLAFTCAFHRVTREAHTATPVGRRGSMLLYEEQIHTMSLYEEEINITMSETIRTKILVLLLRKMKVKDIITLKLVIM